jgi:undecaprenyl-diphosphatase
VDAPLVNQPITHLVDRTRPYLAHPAHSHLLIARSADPSFPSDHATGGLALAFGVWLYDRAIGSALLVVAALLSFSRVYVGTHYPGDVVAGALVGVAVAGALYLVAPTRRLVEGFALRAGRIWDRLLHRGSSPHAA